MKKDKFNIREGTEIDVSQVPLLDWDALRSADLMSWGSVEDVNLGWFPNNCEVKLEVVHYAYMRGICYPLQRCQTYFYIGTRNFGSVICEVCMPAARYTIFSVCDSAYIYKIHVHIDNLVMCLHCNRRIGSLALRNCKSYKNMKYLIMYQKLYREEFACKKM